MPLGVGVCFNLVFVTLIYVGLVSRPAVVTKNGLRRNVLRTVVADVVVSWVLKRVVIGAVEVDSHRAPLAHQVIRFAEHFRTSVGGSAAVDAPLGRGPVG